MPRPRVETRRHPSAPGNRLAAGAVLFWIIVWQLGSMALGSPLLLPSPVAVLLRLGELLPQAVLWERIGFSLARIAGGFALGALLGTLGALAAARWRVVEGLIAPLISLAKSVPVASITVLALIWLRAANLAVLVVLLVVLPIVYENTLAGLRATDRSLDEMAALFRIPAPRRLRYLVMPRLFPYLSAALGAGMGMAWKAGVAAEVIGIPNGSLGEAIYDAKVYFDTTELFAVTLAVVAVSAASTALVRAALHAVEPIACGAAGHAPALERVDAGAPASADDAQASPQTAAATSPAAGTAAAPLALDGIEKSFAGHRVLRDVSLAARPGEALCLMAPSGAGKTTLMRIVAGLEHADAGSLVMGDACDREPLPAVSMAFQDDRLADQASALANARLPLTPGTAAWDAAPELLRELGLGERLLSPASTCSGGERRRIALARALLAPHGILLLDEPFTGLDATARERAAMLVRSRERNRIVIIATHDRVDAELLGARVIHLVAGERGLSCQPD
ncbi:ATP-binding cassette domain-containing protein [uncultured Enorma sp.]|uniref:ATP-binding cassette domain-containing protein n=1 Tax=uncultured Enorma sp. TaxID=1714346 RepID=UPI002593C09F|nr:ATP-binding cassette domain-containing protein [uncultured Enorma sp.]